MESLYSLLSHYSTSHVEERCIYDITYMWNLKKKMMQMNLFTRLKQNNRLQKKKKTYGYETGNMCGRIN